MLANCLVVSEHWSMKANTSTGQLFEVDRGEARVPRPVVPAGEAKTFRRYDQNQCFLLPPSPDDWLPEDHEARFVSEVVEDHLDLSAIYASDASPAGAPPYHPEMMLELIMFAYATGVTSSRELERRCVVDVAFRWLSANEAPDYRSPSRFRRRHLAALEDLFVQVLELCAEAGLVRLGRVALDGTKLDANASKHKAMSYGTTSCPRLPSSKPR
jgi:transposase